MKKVRGILSQDKIPQKKAESMYNKNSERQILFSSPGEGLDKQEFPTASKLVEQKLNVAPPYSILFPGLPK